MHRLAVIDEGVIKFAVEHQARELSSRQYGELACTLVAWRELLCKTQLIGQDSQLYGGAGYGNVSARVGAPSAPRGERPFLISGTQTGGLACIGLESFCVVQRYDYRHNSVRSFGPCHPSSEAMTHAAIYDLAPHIRVVLHGHSPTLWRSAHALRIPQTAADVGYGTPGMALEVQRLYRTTALSEQRVLAMGGHEDGIIVFGKTAEQAGCALVGALARAYALSCRSAGVGLCNTKR